MDEYTDDELETILERYHAIVDSDPEASKVDTLRTVAQDVVNEAEGSDDDEEAGEESVE